MTTMIVKVMRNADAKFAYCTVYVRTFNVNLSTVLLEAVIGGPGDSIRDIVYV